MDFDAREETGHASKLRGSLYVAADGGMRAHAEVDAAAMRFSHEVERYARALMEADERLQEKERRDPPTGRVETITNPGGSAAIVHVSQESERIERVERELARVRRELSSSNGTDTVMAVTIDEDVK